MKNLLLILFNLLFISGFAQDFHLSSWGNSLKKVKSVETFHLVNEHEIDKDKKILIYKDFDGEIELTHVYYFHKNKLIGVKTKIDHTDGNNSLARALETYTEVYSDYLEEFNEVPATANSFTINTDQEFVNVYIDHSEKGYSLIHCIFKN